jgi:hypothetical protein
MSSRSSAVVQVSMHGRFFLSFCAACNHFVAASTEFGWIAIAARAHRCGGTNRQCRKDALRVDPADRWLRTSGAIA